ncbi:uncharacterized protein BO80DRAFT_480521 [Aspergillus ibericus CBS 121593]|uniref:Uncharacterized protein n=1 Tax=Aspergillus ibericus CBS 121593 TaxID=1448316 RepID=A0A395GRD7_9EURO|nr:hypothetical protein BO80DRAFT_480521 [Aspergillus ibericus CBS 121593]RAK98130.1 hypothetical protein BO80DRAFT_480521 [Aspergillus ibericus CBS 121593]
MGLFAIPVTFTAPRATSPPTATSEAHPAEDTDNSDKGYLIAHNLEKKDATMHLATMAQVSVMRRSLVDQLDLTLEETSDLLSSDYYLRKDYTVLKPDGIVRNVSWGFDRGSATYQTDFYALDGLQVDVVIVCRSASIMATERLMIVVTWLRTERLSSMAITWDFCRWGMFKAKRADIFLIANA